VAGYIGFMMVMMVKLCLLMVMLWRCGETCQSRSGMDKYREKYSSHQGQEPTYETPKKYELTEEDKKRILRDGKIVSTNVTTRRERGEIKIGDDYLFPIAQTKMGMLHGRIEKTRDGNRVLAFRGIRHVQPPVGNLRFKPPVETPSWKGLVEAKSNGHVCPQHLAHRADTWVGDEDCLWLNVFTRDLDDKKQRPVVVWIHGGSFTKGSAAEYGPEYLLDEDIVLVTIQYRLGLFGFLSTESASAPGNYGMHDQVAALKWVRTNIKAFSGDPDMVTIMGQQAGGASVHYHILSPITRELFNRAVSLSGSALCWWASIKRPQEKAKKLARLVDCPQNDMVKLTECLRGKSVLDLMNTSPNFYEWKHLEQNQEPLTAWSPRVDPEVDIDSGHLSFMPQEPIDIMKSGKFQRTSWITGITDDEGATRAAPFFADDAGVKDFEEKFEKYGPLMFGFHDGQSEAPMMNAKKVKDHYFGDKMSTYTLVDAISDSAYAHPIETAAEIHAKNGVKVYLYHFGYRGTHSLNHIKPNTDPPTLFQPSTEYGVGNGDDLIYLFPIHPTLFTLSPDEVKFSKTFIDLLISFAKSGVPSLPETHPNLEWTTVNVSDVVFKQLNIGNVIEMDKGLPNRKRMAFWKEMPTYWNADHNIFKPAPVVWKEEL